MTDKIKYRLVEPLNAMKLCALSCHHHTLKRTSESRRTAIMRWDERCGARTQRALNFDRPPCPRHQTESDQTMCCVRGSRQGGVGHGFNDVKQNSNLKRNDASARDKTVSFTTDNCEPLCASSCQCRVVAIYMRVKTNSLRMACTVLYCTGQPPLSR